MKVVKAGTILNGPDGMAYRVTRDCKPAEAITRTMFEAIGGAPEPAAHSPMPHWLVAHLKNPPWTEVDE